LRDVAQPECSRIARCLGIEQHRDSAQFLGATSIATLRDADKIDNAALETGFAVGKGATRQAFVAMVGEDKLEIDVAA
jgi:hypothetical protein